MVKSAMTPNRCETCRHFRASTDCSNLGECRRFPPVLAIGSTVAKFPIVSIDSCCGEFGQAGSDSQQAVTAIATAARWSEPEPAAALAGATPEARDDVFARIRDLSPVTACDVARSLAMPLAIVEQTVAELESAGLIRRWVDQSEYGMGRTFLGLAAPNGLGEPTPIEDPTAPPAGVDPRTLLALVRNNTASEGIKRWAKILRASVEKVREAAEQLERLGHVKIRNPLTVAALIPTSPSWRY